jgi:hypothetical protein
MRQRGTARWKFVVWLGCHEPERSANASFAFGVAGAGVSISIEVVCPDTGTLLGTCQVEQVEHPGIVNSTTTSPANPNRFWVASIFFEFPWGWSLLNSSVGLAGPSLRQSARV